MLVWEGGIAVPGVCSKGWPPMSSLLEHLPLIEAGDIGTITHSMLGRMNALYPEGECDKLGKPGTRITLFFINCWAMVFPSDYPVD